MTKKIFYKAISILAVIVLSVSVSAQSKTAVKATADRTQILIGQPIIITLEADIPENEPIRFFQLDSLPHFEILAMEKIDTVNTGTGTVLKQVVHITSFDSGHWVIPALALMDSIATDSIPVDVSFTAFDPQQPYHDIKEIIEVNPEEEKKQNWWWYVAGGAVVLLVILYFALRKKKPVLKATEAPIDPYQEAMDHLIKLQKDKRVAKEYYSILVDIFRVYLERKKGIHSLQTTSDDLIGQLRGLDLDKQQFESLAGSLRQADFVKFAKYIPSQEDDRTIFNVIKEAIQSIEQIK